MFVDPLGTVLVSLPPRWAFLPAPSSVTTLFFADWTSPKNVGIIAVFLAPGIDAGRTDGDWKAVVRGLLPHAIARIEGRGPVVLAEVPRDEKRGGLRVAWVRGPRVCVSIEQQEVPPGGSLTTPELAEVLCTLKVPVNYRLVQARRQDEWIAAMDAAVESRHRGDAAAALRYMSDAGEIARQVWLESLASNLIPDIFAAAREAEAELACAALTGSIQLLRDATTTLYRCRRSLLWPEAAARPANKRTSEHVERLLGHALDLHARWGHTNQPPQDPLQACIVRSRLFRWALADATARATQETPAVSWGMISNLAVAGAEDALSAMAAAGRAAQGRVRFTRLPPDKKAAVIAAGASDDASLEERLQQEELQILENLVEAGRALCSVTLAATGSSALSVRENALLAARRLSRLSPSPDCDRAMVDIINGYAGALCELGDRPSLDQTASLLAEAQGILDRLGDESRLRALTCTNEAWVCYERKRVEEGLALADRAIAFAGAAKADRAEGVARSCRSHLLNLAGRHQEALEEAGRALAMLRGPAASVVHESLATAYEHLGDRSAALDELRTALAVAIADNPVSDAVERIVSAAARIWEPCDPEACLRASEAADLVVDARRVDIGGPAERIAYDDSRAHRGIAAALVRSRIGSDKLAGALATADRHRARSLVDAASLEPSGGDRISLDMPKPDVSLRDQVAFVASTARAFLKHWGVPPSLDGAALSRLVADHGRTVILFHPTSKDLHVFVVKPGAPVSIDAVIARVPVAEVLDLTDALRREIGSAVSRAAERAEGARQAITRRETGPENERLLRLRRDLHDALFSEVVPFPSHRQPITIVPYRELAVIPLAILTGADGEDLVVHHPLSVLPSIASLGAMACPGGGRPRAVVVGDPLLPPRLGLPPLRGALDEADCVAKMLAGAAVDTTPLLGPEASEVSFRQSVAGARVVHLACHAALYEPASASRLYLTPSEHDDGMLLPAEIADLRLDGALVVLAACESGLGRATADGVLGLGRAFMQAGARAMVLSLWQVDDVVTAFLMREFYRGLLGTGEGLDGQRLDVAASVQRSQLLARREWSDDPINWGPWLVVGDGGWRI
jgi:CHAT domain-containing protein